MENFLIIIIVFIIFICLFYLDIEKIKEYINLFYCRHQWQFLEEHENDKLLKCEKCNDYKVVSFDSSCRHEWEILSRENICNPESIVIGKFLLLQCKKCGETTDRSHKI